MPLNIHPADPDHPKGMAWVMGVGFVDPRPGKTERQPMALTQCWEETSALWWSLGLRWHPELATKWSRGGGQFSVSEIVDKDPGPEQTLEQGAEEILEALAEEHPEYAEMLKTIRQAGSDEDRAQLSEKFEGEIKRLLALSKYINTKG